MTRKERLLSGITKEMKGLEIGPSINPIVPKREGYQVETIDHTDKQGLIDKYLTDEQSKDKIDQIEEVDYVWNGGSYLELTNRPGYYDYVIACHVIEHTVDMIGFLQDCQAMLKDKGRLILAVPDKRFEFDLYKPVTTTGQLIDVHQLGRPFHSYGSVVDHFFHAVNGGIRLTPDKNQVTDSWGNYNVRDDELVFPKHNIKSLKPVFEMAKKQEEYVDIHRFVYTPASFELLIHELALLDIVHFKVESISKAIGYEFIVKLVKDDSASSGEIDENEELKKRFELLRRIKEEETFSEYSFEEILMEKHPIHDLTMHHAIDECRYEKGQLFVRGWVFKEGFDADDQVVYLSVIDRQKGKRHFYPLVKTLRPDVTDRMSDSRYELSGFIGFIPMTHMDEYYLDNENLEIMLMQDDKLIYNAAQSNYSRLTEPKMKKIARKILKK